MKLLFEIRTNIWPLLELWKIEWQNYFLFRNDGFTTTITHNCFWFCHLNSYHLECVKNFEPWEHRKHSNVAESATDINTHIQIPPISYVGFVLHSTTVATASRSTLPFKGTMRVLWHYCNNRLRSYCACSSWRLPSLYPQRYCDVQ